mmetsp:Transcript_4995/g.6883  ORF Transcript_4995/g.6883 Transcript_4995/m.6883 type:complete len:226 (-) Transcript_4995:280-957(-)|eukprot:CAMPEP_0185738698 /NCGR_PEP_ID=MMETSP1171-20130828/33643_1 /TAXON_ID=374046 /ORGANISM="Helicotheca tamensis, Strain CCMP826" /LENGTH=225 /DNA_ID=CAMNT_0028410023 /DNA_START=11 /DNA_END=688 /DNA_ORIENTATION=+
MLQHLLSAAGVSFSIFSTFVIHRLICPTVLSYPWRVPKNKDEYELDKTKKVILAGSYNPPHHGHLAMLAYLAERYGEVIAVIGVNANKKYDVTPAQRADLVKKMIAAEQIRGKIRVEVVPGYIWRYAIKENVSIMYRGIRSWEKDGSEERFLYVLNSYGPILLGPFRWPIPTYYLQGKPEYLHISSTLVRDLCKKAKKEGKEPELSSILPKSVAGDVSNAYCKDL